MEREVTPEELKEYEEYRRKCMERNAELMGLSVDELIKIEEKARAEVLADDEWEKELNERNKSRAGIIESK